MSGNHYDVIIIGSGAGGGTLAYRLAPSGKQILLLERGEYVPREKENWDSHAVAVENRYHVDEAWLDSKGKEFLAGTHYYVGGNTKFYGAALIRLRARDFGELRYHGGTSPAWPLQYEEFEPYYTEAEHLYHVHGQRGADPTEPPASAPYSHPPLQHEPRIREIVEGLERQGCQPFPMPVGIMRDESNPRTSKCIRCNTCDGFPCLIHAKADAEVVCIEPALRYPNVSIMTGAYVERLETDASGKSITKVIVRQNGKIESISASIVVSACGAINSAALLLRSANATHPNGLANGSDQVGRNYMCHVNSMYLALSRHRNETRFNKTFGLNDFYFGAEDYAFPMGHISLISAIDANILRAGAPRFTPTKPLEVMAEHAVPFWCTTEDLPNPENRVTLSPDGRIVLQYMPNNEEAHKHLLRKLKTLLKHIECEEHMVPLQAYVPGRIPLAGVAHQNGTARFGRDAATSVLDTNCRAHEIDNLYVVDGSFFPSCGAVNPALTIIANALRVGDHLKERLS
ncbi:MAG TPA: GMC family oxidoreductase [Candidatus Hydrogenedentes bacterium]|nr:GMC family oxidoreductase [Candidatus Hydrogenedentota bacterium]